MPAAIPNYLQNSFSDAAPGHRFGLYYAGWNDDFSKPKSGAAQTLKATVCPLPPHSRNLLKNLVDRQNALTSGLTNSFAWPAIATSPFASGLGNEHPLENGFAFLSPYGLPYLPGSGVKGVIRRAAEELASGEWGENKGWTQAAIDNLFGPGENDPDRDDHPHQGALRFWDVFPTPETHIKNDKALLGVEIMTPHLCEYYQGTATPNTSLTPVPIPFLAVVAQSRFGFHVEANLGLMASEFHTTWQNLLHAAFTHAGEWLGFGAKTAVGYGRMELDPAIALQREEETTKHQKAAEQAAENQRRASLPPDEQLIAALDDLLGQLPKDPRNGQAIRQSTSHNLWNQALDLLHQGIESLQTLTKPQREQLASQSKAKLTTAFKVEGKAEKAMKEKLGMVRGL